MARPIEIGGEGGWSVRQASAVTGLSGRHVRWVLERSPTLIDLHSDADLLALRVLHALRDWPPLPTTVDPVLAEDRDRAAVAAAHDSWEAGNPDWRLLVDPMNARLVRAEAALLSWLGVSPDVPFLVLPVGAWGRQIHAEIGALRVGVA